MSTTQKQGIFTFPNPVNEISARIVAGGVVCLSLVILITQQWWLLIPLTYGFLARVIAGPTLSPLGLFSTRVATPFVEKKFHIKGNLVPGPPKRFAQTIGLSFSLGALISYALFDQTTVAFILITFLCIAAILESVLGLCLGCKMFALLMRIGVIPEEICEACNDLSKRTVS